MSALLALLAAAAWGVSDFVGGLATRRIHVLEVLAITYSIGTVGVCACLPLLPGEVSLRTVLLASVAGVIGLCGVGLLYAGLAAAPMNIVSPITGVLSAGVPVAAGVAFGERPSAIAWSGIALGIAAVVLVSRQPEDHPHGPVGMKPLAMAVGAGLGFGGFFVLIARTPTSSGLWPVAIARIAAMVVVLAVALPRRDLRKVPPRPFGLAMAAALLDTAANVGFLYATRHGLLSLASVLTALYPAGTVLLALVVLREPLARIQGFGLGLAAVSVVLITR